METVEITCTTITKLDTDLIKVVYRDGYLVELEDAKEVDDVFLRLSDGHAVYTLMDTNGRYSVFDPKALQFFSNEAPMVVQKRMLGFAVIIDSLPNRLLAKFYITFFKPKFIFKIFSREKDAHAFLLSLKEESLDEVG